jgi:hypothetical protein
MRLAQHVEHRVAPDPNTQFAQRLSQHVMQLARAQPRLSNTLPVHQSNHGSGAIATSLLPLLPLVVRLTAHADMAASPCHTQPLDELLREDLPEGFFTMRTP